MINYTNPNKNLKTRAHCQLIAEVACEAERYEDVIAEIKYIAERLDPHLSIDERNLISIAYKNQTNTLRSSWRVVCTLERMEASRSPLSKRVRLIRKERQQIESQLEFTCKDIVSLLEDSILPVSTEGEETVFYSKMKGDYYRYLAEFSDQHSREYYAKASLEAYTAAYAHALLTLEATHPTRLGLALNFAVFFHDVKSSPERACHLAKSAFDQAVRCLNQFTVADSFMILQLLKDDLIAWSKEFEDEK